MTDEQHEHGCGCGCEHEHHHHHDEECGCGCQHHHEHHEHASRTISANVGGGVAICRLSSHEGANIVSCTLELEDAKLSPSCLSKALQGVAFDVERAEGIVGHIKCAASGEAGTAHISVTAGNIEPTLQVDGLDVLDEESDITIAVIVYAVEQADLLDMLLTRLERVL